MSNLINVPKNGSLANTNSDTNFSNLPNWFEEIFNRELPTVFSSNFNDGITLPKVNIKETPDTYLIEIAAPGLKKSDFMINLDNNALTISTENNQENEVKDEKFTRKEFGYSSFRRTFNLPDGVNADHINATYEEGILNIQLPKKEEAKQKPPRTIRVS